MGHSFSAKEKSVRKLWLILTIISILIWPLVTWGTLAYVAKYEPIPTNWYYLSLKLRKMNKSH